MAVKLTFISSTLICFKLSWSGLPMQVVSPPSLCRPAFVSPSFVKNLCLCGPYLWISTPRGLTFGSFLFVAHRKVVKIMAVFSSLLSERLG